MNTHEAMKYAAELEREAIAKKNSFIYAAFDAATATPTSDYEKIAEHHTKELRGSMKQTISESEYEKNRAAYVEYLLMCVRLGDWHGVSDAANDLRVLEAKQEGYA